MKSLSESILSGRDSSISNTVRGVANLELCKELFEVLSVRKFRIGDISDYDGRDKGLSVYHFRYIDPDGRSMISQLVSEIKSLYRKHGVEFNVEASGKASNRSHYFSVATHTDDYQKYGINFPDITFTSMARYGTRDNHVTIKAPSSLKEEAKKITY